MFGFFRKRRDKRRAALKATPLSDAAWATIDQNVPLVKKRSDEERQQLGGIIQVLLAEKRFEGCQGMVITEEVKLTIAAQAALLLLNRNTDFYPTLKNILVYPSAYMANTPNGLVTHTKQIRFGESWFKGDVVLSWEHVLHGARATSDGRNVAFHEFAHQLDGEMGGMEGIPRVAHANRLAPWAQAIRDEYAALCDATERGKKTLLDGYGTINHAEFFAVATEVFFERPRAMQRRHPELYNEFATFYAQDPAAAKDWRHQAAGKHTEQA